MAVASGPLAGLRILEIGGIGPGPFCGLLLADLGYERIDGVLHAQPGPRFSRTPGRAGMGSRRGQHQQDILNDRLAP